MLWGNSPPDTQDDAGCLGSGILTRKFFPQALIQKTVQFVLVGRLTEPIQHGVEPCSLDPLRDSDDLAHASSLVIATNGTMTSSRAMPPWATTLSPLFVNALRSPESRTYRAGGK